MLKVDKNLVIVVYKTSAYYHYNYNELKKILFEGLKNNLSIDKDTYNKMSLQDIDNSIQQVLIGDDIINNLVDDEPIKGNYTCCINGCINVKIPSYFFKNVK